MITTTDKNSIANLISNVNINIGKIDENILIEDFHNFVLSQKEEKLERKNFFNDVRLNQLVPNIHKNYVLSIIKNQFGNDEQAYIDTIPLFFRLFTNKSKKICDEIITSMDKAERRKLNKKRKHLIIYSMQLLKLVGLNRSSIISNDCLDYYKDEMAKTDEFLNTFRLVSPDGKITKLTSNESKQKQKLAQVLKVSECFDQISKDRNFTFSLITLTLPPAYHCNPMNGTSPFAGYTPQQALDTLNGFWQSIRSHLAQDGLKFGTKLDLFGVQVLELQKSSTLHLHCLMYSNEQNQSKIIEVIERVKHLHNSKYDTKNVSGLLTKEEVEFNKLHIIKSFDVKLNDGRAGNSGAKYVFKYITKTHSNYKDGKPDDSAIKNMACRYFYGCRGFNFFGLKGSITKFNFIQKNFEIFKKQLDSDLVRVLERGDYYDFLQDYEKYFRNVYYKDRAGKRRLLGVAFDKTRFEDDNDIGVYRRKYTGNEVILIEKRQYCVFEKNYEEEIKTVKKLDLNAVENIGISKAFEIVKKKQEFYNEQKEEFKNKLNELSACELLLNDMLVSSKLQLLNTFQEKAVQMDVWLSEDEFDMKEVLNE